MPQSSTVRSVLASFKYLCRTSQEPQLWLFRLALPKSCDKNLFATSADAGIHHSEPAFFCPACGRNSAENTFSQTLEAVRKSLAALPAIREAVQAYSGADAAVDQEYITKSGDQTYAVGQRLVVRVEAVHRTVNLVSELTNELRKFV